MPGRGPAWETRLILQLIEEGPRYFLSRSRRFGKNRLQLTE